MGLVWFASTGVPVGRRQRWHNRRAALSAAPIAEGFMNRPLIIRLRNWVGDVVLSVPLLARLESQGYALQLVGKRWAADLLAGHGWPIEPLASGLRGRIGQLRAMAQAARAQEVGFDQRLNAVSLPFSFSSALDMRLAGLRALGYAYEGRGLLLAQSMPRDMSGHELELYWRLGDALLGRVTEPPKAIALKTTAAELAAARELRARHGISGGYVVICPFAGGTFEKLDKRWPAFAAFAAGPLRELRRPIVIVPGPGEETAASARIANAIALPNVGLGTYAALLQEAALMISNDTGPGHIAAAVGTPTLSVLGPTNAAQWRAWGPNVKLVRGDSHTVDGLWPTPQQVFDAAARMLGETRSAVP
jgi:heptosyltransferase II